MKRSTSNIHKLKSYALIPALCALVMIFGLSGCSKKKTASFEVSDDAQFYVVSKNMVSGYRLENDQPQNVTSSRVDVYLTDINLRVNRAKLEDRYLVFSEEDWPKGTNQAVVSLDFKEGKAIRKKTKHIAFTSAGYSPSHYYAMTSAKGMNLAVYTPDLQEVAYEEVEDSLVLQNFMLQSDSGLTAGSISDEEPEAEGMLPLTNSIFAISLNGDTLEIENDTVIDEVSDRQYWYGDTIDKGDYVYSLSPGYRMIGSYEKSNECAIYRFDPKYKSGEFFPLEVPGGNTVYDIGDDLMAVGHESATTERMGFTLYSYEMCMGWYIDLLAQGIAYNPDGIHDIARLDERTLLILTGNSLIGYDLNDSQITFTMEIEPEVNNPFQIWIAKE